MEKHTELCKHFNFQMNTGSSSLVVALIYEQLGVHINTVPLHPLPCNQGGLTPNVPRLKPENHLSSLHFIHLLMHSCNTYLVSTYYVPGNTLGIKNPVVRETDPGNRPFRVYSVDSRGKKHSSNNYMKDLKSQL